MLMFDDTHHAPVASSWSSRMSSAEVELMVANQAVRLAASWTAGQGRAGGTGCATAAWEGSRQAGRLAPGARQRQAGRQACMHGSGAARAPCATTSVFWK